MTEALKRYRCADCKSSNLERDECKLDECSEVAWARGWCKPHYDRWWRKGDPLAPDGRKRNPTDEFRALDEAPIWEGVDQHARERLNVA